MRPCSASWSSSGAADVAAEEAGLGVQDAVDERVRVGIVGVPAAHDEVDVRLLLGGFEVLGHRLVGGADAEADLRETLRVSSRKKAENSPKKTGWTAADELDRSRATRVASTELSGEPRPLARGPLPGPAAE